jgi:hypothetical protein
MRRSRLRSARQHFALARRFDPDLPDGFAAEAALQPINREGTAKYLAVIDRGLAANPDSALLHGLKSRVLESVGLMVDSVTEAEQAAEPIRRRLASEGRCISALA